MLGIESKRGVESMADGVRVRFAPSPTGYLHIGGARTCLFNWLFARHNGGKLILRIEDTDQERLKQGSIEQIIESLKWLGLDWDEGPDTGGDYGPYFQSQRVELYRREAEKLINNGKAYYCYCTPEEIEAQREEANRLKKPFRYDGRCRELPGSQKKAFEQEGRKPVVRLKVPFEGATVVDDVIRGRVSFENSLLDDFIIMKSNGVATYNFACVVDDSSMNISHVVRAEEHLSNTPKQVLLYDALGAKPPVFAHVPMILAPDRSKLSKRHGATSVEEFREQGYLPEAIVNYLCLLGWSARDQNDIFPPEDAIRQFSFERVSKNAAIYDTKKLTWINGHYLKNSDIDRIAGLAVPFLAAKGLVPASGISGEQREKIKSVIGLVREKVWTLAEIADASSYFFTGDFLYEEKGVEKYFKNEGIPRIFSDIYNIVKNIEPFDKEELEAQYRACAEARGIKAGDMIHPTRLALTGRIVSPGLFEVMELLGRDECLKRLDRAIDYVRNIRPLTDDG